MAKKRIWCNRHKRWHSEHAAYHCKHNHCPTSDLALARGQVTNSPEGTCAKGYKL